MRIAALLTVAMVIFGGVPVFAQGQQTSQRLAEMRAELVTAALAQSRNEAAIHAKVEAIRAAELALAKARATSRTASLAPASSLTMIQPTSVLTARSVWKSNRPADTIRAISF